MMKKPTIYIVLICLLSLFVYLWLRHGVGAADVKNPNAQTFVIRSGAGLKEITHNLSEQHLIADPVVFFLVVKFHGIDKKIQHGNFRIDPSMDALTVAKTLTHGTTDIIVTIPEGKRALEIAEILKENVPSYDDSWKSQLEEKEGYLFPDTYYIHPQTTIDKILLQFQSNFDEKYAEATKGSVPKYTQEQIVILASLIEREARLSEDRPLIASVLENRLTVPMRLQVDATVQYALGYDYNQKSWWRKNLTVDELQVVSPYNTYTHDGLPPGPIANPGLAALTAAANPAKSNYLYYMTDSNGITHYARSLEEHNANIKKYGI